MKLNIVDLQKGISITFLVVMLSLFGKAKSQEGPGLVEVSSIAFSPNGDKLAVAAGPLTCSEEDLAPYTIHILDSGTQEVLQNLTRHHCIANTIAWSPEGSKLVSSGDDGLAFVWDIASGEVLTSPENASLGLPRRGVTWDSSGQLVADFSIGSPNVNIWNGMTGTLEATLKDDGDFDVGTISWSPDGKLIAVADQGSRIQIWDVFVVLSGGTAQQVAVFKNVPANAMMWSPDSHQIAVGVENNVVILDFTTGQPTSNLIGHEDIVIAVAWSPDGTRLASSGLDHAIRIWDVGAGETISLIQESYVVRAVSWSPDGTQLAYGSDNGNIEIIPALDGVTTLP